MPTETLRPNAPGDKCSLGGSPNTCPNNYLNVKEVIPDDEGSWVRGQDLPEPYIAGDLYKIETSALTLPAINFVRIHGRYRLRTSPCGAKECLKTHGNEYCGEKHTLGGTWTPFQTSWAVNPTTLLPWTWEEIRDLQIGPALFRTMMGLGWAYCTQIYVEVEYAVVSPTVSTNPATSVTADAATLKGTLDADGEEACNCGFEWGETIGYGNTTLTQSRTTGQTFAQTISGLDPKKTYHFRALAANSAGPGNGADRTFTTLAVAPTVATNPAIEINNNSATLKGKLTYDGGEACNCGFEYGETEDYGTITPIQSKVTGEAFSQPITGLDPNTTYHFRAIATNSAETSRGADRTFKTLVSAPAVTTNEATGLAAVLATLNGTLNDDIGEACECGFEWGLDTDYGTITPTESKRTDEDFSQVIGGLIPNTVYHFRAFATNSFGTGHGDDETFTTALIIKRAYALARREL